MPTEEHYQPDIFAIIVLISAVLIIVFLLIAAVYFFNLMNLKPPSKSESTFLFWTTIILALIFIAIAVYSLIQIFTYKSPQQTVTQQVTKKSTVANTPVSTPPPIQQTTSTPIKLPPNIPKTTRATNLSSSFSDVPIPEVQLDSLKQQLVSLGDITGGP